MDDMNTATPTARSAGRRRPRPKTFLATFGSAKRKLTIVQQLLRGESLEAVSRKENVPVHRLTRWRDKVLMGAENALKERERDARDDEVTRLRAKVGEITMDYELLQAKIDKMESGRPRFAPWRRSSS